MKWLAAACFILWLMSAGVLVLVDLETADKIALILFSFCSLSVPAGLGLGHLIKSMNPDD